MIVLCGVNYLITIIILQDMYNVCVYIYIIITLYTLNLHNVICQLYIIKAGGNNSPKKSV